MGWARDASGAIVLPEYVDALRDRALPADAYVFSTLDKRSQVLPELQPFFERIVALQHPALASLARPPRLPSGGRRPKPPPEREHDARGRRRRHAAGIANRRSYRFSR